MILHGIDHSHMLAALEAQHLGMARVVRREPQREGGRLLGADRLLVEEEAMQRHIS